MGMRLENKTTWSYFWPCFEGFQVVTFRMLRIGAPVITIESNGSIMFILKYVSAKRRVIFKAIFKYVCTTTMLIVISFEKEFFFIYLNLIFIFSMIA